jgi:hypothetical protein
LSSIATGLEPHLAKVAVLKDIFRPSTPTIDVELFQGRQRELDAVIAGLQDVGQHVVIYGDRGVGKTSLSYIAKGVFLSIDGLTSLVVRVQCSKHASFDAIWRAFHSRFREEAELLSPDVVQTLTPLMYKLEELLAFDDIPLTVSRVSEALRRISRELRLLVVIDEFDRIGGQGASEPFADLIKSLADDLTKTTIIVVGVAADVGGLIEGHESIRRNIKQVEMPRMSQKEIRDIVNRGYDTYRVRSGDSLSVEPKAAAAIAHLAQGLPYYAHLLAGAAGSEAILRGSPVVTLSTVLDAMVTATDDADHDIKVNYHDATNARADAQFEQTLVACALAEVDHLGYFSHKGVGDAVAVIADHAKPAASFSHHLKRFAAEPVTILESRWQGKRIVRYRFRDPLMKPFVLMKGVQTGIIKVERFAK